MFRPQAARIGRLRGVRPIEKNGNGYIDQIIEWQEEIEWKKQEDDITEITF